MHQLVATKCPASNAVAVLIAVLLSGSRSDRVSNGDGADIHDHVQQMANTTSTTCCCNVTKAPWDCGKKQGPCSAGAEEKQAPNVDWNQIVCLEKDYAYRKAPYNLASISTSESVNQQAFTRQQQKAEGFFRIALDTERMVQIGPIRLWHMQIGDVTQMDPGIELTQVEDEWRLTIAGTERCGNGKFERMACASMYFQLEWLHSFGYGLGGDIVNDFAKNVGFQLKFHLNTSSTANDLMFAWLDEVEDLENKGSLVWELVPWTPPRPTGEEESLTKRVLEETVKAANMFGLGKMVNMVTEVMDYTWQDPIKTRVAKEVLKVLQTMFVKLAESPLSHSARMNKFSLRLNEAGAASSNRDLLQVEWLIDAQFAVSETAAFGILKDAVCKDGEEDSATCNAAAVLNAHRFTDFFRVPILFKADAGFVSGKAYLSFWFEAEADLRLILQANSRVCKDVEKEEVCVALKTAEQDTVMLVEGTKDGSAIAVEVGVPKVELEGWSMGLSAHRDTERNAITVGLSLPAEGEATAVVEFPSFRCIHVGAQQAIFQSCELLQKFFGMSEANGLRMHVSVKNFEATIEAQADGGAVGVHLCDTACGHDGSAPEIRASMETDNVRLALVGGPTHALLEIDVQNTAVRELISALKSQQILTSMDGGAALKVSALSMGFTDVHVLDFKGQMLFNDAFGEDGASRMDCRARFHMAVTGLKCDPACGLLGQFLEMQDELMAYADVRFPVAVYTEDLADEERPDEGRYSFTSCNLGWSSDPGDPDCGTDRDFKFSLMTRKVNSNEYVYADIKSTAQGTSATAGFVLNFQPVWSDIMKFTNDKIREMELPVTSVRFDKFEFETHPRLQYGCLHDRPYVKLHNMVINSKVWGFTYKGPSFTRINGIWSAVKTTATRAAMLAANQAALARLITWTMNIQFFAFLGEGEGPRRKPLHVCWQTHLPYDFTRKKWCAVLETRCKKAAAIDCEGKVPKDECEQRQQEVRSCSQFNFTTCAKTFNECKRLAAQSFGTKVGVVADGGSFTTDISLLVQDMVQDRVTYKLAWMLSRMVEPLISETSCKNLQTKVPDPLERSSQIHLKALQTYEIQFSAPDISFPNSDAENKAIAKLLETPMRGHLKHFLPVAQMLQDGAETTFWMRVPLPTTMKVFVVPREEEWHGLVTPAWTGDFVLQKEWLINRQPVWRCQKGGKYWTIYFMPPWQNYPEGWWTMAAKTDEDIIPQLGELYADRMSRPGASPPWDLQTPKRLVWWASDQYSLGVIFRVLTAGEGSLFGSDAEFHFSMEARHPIVMGTLAKGKTAIEAAAEFSLLGVAQSVPQAHLAKLATVLLSGQEASKIQKNLNINFTDGILNLCGGFWGHSMTIQELAPGLTVHQGQKETRLNQDLREDLIHDAVNGLGPLPMSLNAPTDRTPFPSILDLTQADVHTKVTFDGTTLNVEKLHGTTAILMPYIGLLIDEVSPTAHNFAFGMGLLHVSKLAEVSLLSDGWRGTADDSFKAGKYFVWLNCGFLRIWPSDHLGRSKVFAVETYEQVMSTASKCFLFKVKEVTVLPTKQGRTSLEETAALYQFCQTEISELAARQLNAWVYLMEMEAERLKVARDRGGQCNASNPQPLNPELVPRFPLSDEWRIQSIEELERIIKPPDSSKLPEKGFWRPLKKPDGEEGDLLLQ